MKTEGREGYRGATNRKETGTGTTQERRQGQRHSVLVSLERPRSRGTTKERTRGWTGRPSKTRRVTQWRRRSPRRYVTRNCNGPDKNRDTPALAPLNPTYQVALHRPLYDSIRRTKWSHTSPCTTQSDTPSDPIPALVPLNPVIGPLNPTH